jgi:hypothetical protein
LKINLRFERFLNALTARDDRRCVLNQYKR